MAIVAPPYEPRRFTVDDYHRMAEVGIFDRKERIELIDGEIITMSPIGSRHLSCVNRLAHLLMIGLAPRAIIQVKGSIRLGPHSEPQPDIALLRPRADFYAPSLPTAPELFAVIEVMDTSAAYDRGVKLRLYAREGIAEAWLVDLAQERVEVFRGPASGAYSHQQVAARGDSVSPDAFPDLVLAVDDILGPPVA